MNKQPFYIGQRVVCVKDHSKLLVKKGYEAIVTNVGKFPCGGLWVSVGIVNAFDHIYCIDCNSKHYSGHDMTFGVSLFAPITENFIEIEYSKVLELEKPLICAQ